MTKIYEVLRVERNGKFVNGHFKDYDGAKSECHRLAVKDSTNLSTALPNFWGPPGKHIVIHFTNAEKGGVHPSPFSITDNKPVEKFGVFEIVRGAPRYRYHYEVSETWVK